MTAERRRAFLGVSPFHAGRVVTALVMDRPRFPSSRLKPGGLPPTLAGWEAVIGPARAETAHLVVNVYALDGAPRITHVRGLTISEERTALRSRAYGAGVWPPEGGPEEVAEAMSAISLP